MLRNLQDHGYEVPQMSILFKDQMEWNELSQKPVPSRPIVSGNSCLNTHLSEIISELIGPIALERNGAEIQSRRP